MPFKDPEKKREYEKKYREINKNKTKDYQHNLTLNGKAKEYWTNHKQKHEDFSIKKRIYDKITRFEKNKPTLLRNQKRVYDIFKTLYDDEIFIGLMLGDGSLQKIIYKNSRFNLGQSYEHKEFVFKIQEYFADLGINCSVKLMFNKKAMKYWYFLYTEFNEAFSMLRKIWYPDNASRVIPSYIKITPKTLAYHFMGDGTSSWSSNITSRIALCTNTFPVEDTIRLSNMISKLGIQNTVYKIKTRNNQFIIKIGRKESVEKFYDVVEEYIIPCFKYKIKRHRPELDGRVLSRGIRKSPKTEFKKGNIPWNKGKKY